MKVDLKTKNDETKEVRFMSKEKLKWETPELVNFNVQGTRGANCISHGNSNLTGVCIGGPGDSGWCQSGGAPAGGFCDVGTGGTP